MTADTPKEPRTAAGLIASCICTPDQFQLSGHGVNCPARAEARAPEGDDLVRAALDLPYATARGDALDGAFLWDADESGHVVSRAAVLALLRSRPAPSGERLRAALIATLYDWLETTNIMEEAHLDGADVTIFENSLAAHGLVLASEPAADGGTGHRSVWDNDVPTGWCECGQPAGHVSEPVADTEEPSRG